MSTPDPPVDPVIPPVDPNDPPVDPPVDPPTPPITPPTPPKVELPTSIGFHEIPKDFSAWPKEDREAFLKLQFFSKDDSSCVLYDCYAQGTKVTHLLNIIHFFVAKLKERIGPATEDETTAHKLGRAFAKALNKAIVQLGKAAYDNAKTLLDKGKFPETGPALPPIKIPDLFPEDDEFQSTVEDNQDESIGDIIVQTLKLLCNENKFLNHIYPLKGGISFFQMIMSAIKAGEEFYNEWSKDPSKLPLKDGHGHGKVHVKKSNGAIGVGVGVKVGGSTHTHALAPKGSWDKVAELALVRVPSVFTDEEDAE